MINYINLTSGLEWAPKLDDYKLVRIQSSNFEVNKKWTAIMDLDYQFLIDAATEGVVLCDCGSRRDAVSRAQWQGVPWIKWAYEKANKVDFLNTPPITRGVNVQNEFENFYTFGEADRIRKKAKAKMRYVAKLTGSKYLWIENASMESTLDGQTEDLARLGGLREA